MASLDHVVADHPTAFLLQEVCEGQANEISRELRARGLHYVERFHNASSKKWNLGCGGLEGWGNVVFHVGDRLGEVKEGTFAAQDGWLTRAQNRGYVCVHVPSPSFWACSTHIDVKPEPQKGQLDELARIADGLAHPSGGGSVPVVIGGDFNVKPESAALDGVFAGSYARGRGHLVELDVTPNDAGRPHDVERGRERHVRPPPRPSRAAPAELSRRRRICAGPILASRVRMEVRAPMTRHVTVIPESLSVGNAWRIMQERHIRHLPVVNGGKLVGIISDRDLLRHGHPAPDGELTFTNGCVADIMTLCPIVCPPDASVSNAARLMTEKKIDALPIVSSGKLVGLLTSTDLLQLLIDDTRARIPFDFQIALVGQAAPASA